VSDIRCLSVKTTCYIGTPDEVVIWDAFYQPDEEKDALEYKSFHEKIGNKPEKPWGEFSVEIVPLYDKSGA
jgi:hypothetical protein